jgi:hypothetical protein
MPRYTIVPIVEGEGEFEAVPVLIDNWLRFREFYNFKTSEPIRASGKGSLTVRHDKQSGLGVEQYIKYALIKNASVILILLDADKECPAKRGPELLARARAVVANGFPVGVVVAKPEFEAWFLAALGLPAFRRKRLIIENQVLTPKSLPLGFDVEGGSGCKGDIADWLGMKFYDPKVHQKDLTAHIPFTPAMLRRSRSFRKLLKELETLTAAARSRARSGR